VKLDSNGYNRADGAAFFQRLHERLAALPGVTSVAFSENVPLGLSGGSWEDLVVPGYTPAPSENMKIYRNLVSTDYFCSCAIRWLHGRAFHDLDRTSPALPAIVNATFARRYFGATDAVGRTFSMMGGTRVLVHRPASVGDDALRPHREIPQPYFYVAVPALLLGRHGAAVHLRTAGDPLGLLPPSAVKSPRSSNLPVFDASPSANYVSGLALRPADRRLAPEHPLRGPRRRLASLDSTAWLAFARSRNASPNPVRLRRRRTPRRHSCTFSPAAAWSSSAAAIRRPSSAPSRCRLLAGFMFGVSTLNRCSSSHGRPHRARRPARQLAPARRAAHVGPHGRLRAE